MGEKLSKCLGAKGKLSNCIEMTEKLSKRKERIENYLTVQEQKLS